MSMDSEINFDPQHIIELSRQIDAKNVLEHIEHFNHDMTISQVVRFFENQGVEFTKTMIQNYVRLDMLPPPNEKRYYIKEHLILLTLIDNLKNVYSLDEIRRLIQPILKNINTFDDDMIDITAIYNLYVKIYEQTVADWQNELPNIMNNVEALVNASRVLEDEKNEANYFMTILALMVQSIATKKLAEIMIADFNKKII